MAHKHAPHVNNDAPGMKGERSRTAPGRLREKRGDTHVGTIEDMYGVDLEARSDAHLDTILKREGVESLDKLLEKKQ